LAAEFYFKPRDHYYEDIRKRLGIRPVAFPVHNLEANQFILPNNMNNNNVAEESQLETHVNKAVAFMNQLFVELHLTDLGRTPIHNYNHNWVKYVAANIPSWHKYFSGAITINMYLQIVPSEFQTEDHMKVVYMLFAVVELLTSSIILCDDMLDMSPLRGNKPSWFMQHPVTSVVDSNLLVSMAFQILRKLFPRDHPCYEEILERSHDYISTSWWYFGYDSVLWNAIGQHRYGEFMRQAGHQANLPGMGIPSAKLKNGDTGQEQCHIPFDEIDLNAYWEISTIRVHQFIQYVAHMGRLAACYKSVDIGKCDVLLASSAHLMSTLEDFYDYVKKGPGRYDDTKEGVVNVFISTLMTMVKSDLFNEQEKTEIMDVLWRRFGTKSDEDAEEVLVLYEKYGVVKEVQKYLHECVDFLDDCSKTECLEVNFPFRVVLDATLYMGMSDESLDVESKDRLLAIRKRFSGSESSMPMDIFRAMIELN
jgi:hypothetical protein